MTNIVKFGVMSALLAFAPGSLNAQTTNVVLVANISLTGVKQAGDRAAKIRITNSDLLAALNATGEFSFGSKAQLVLVSTEDQLPTFSVREKSGTNQTTTDISGFLTLSEGTEVSGKNNTQSFVYQTYSFDDENGTAFSVSGLTSLRRSTISSPNIGPLMRVSAASGKIGGGGTVAGDAAALRGTIKAGKPIAEVDGD